jgi:ATP-binding cassette, subfamily B, bacterial PglK
VYFLIKRLWGHLERRRQNHYKYVLLLMILASFAEMISIGSILPFITVLTDPNRLLEQEFLSFIFDYFQITSSNQLLLPITLFFISVVIFSGLVRVLLLYSVQRLSYITGADIGINIYKRTLYQDFEVHNSRNTSEVMSGIIRKTDGVVGHIITPVLNIVSSFILFVGIVSSLIIINPNITIYGFLIIGSIYIFISKLTGSRLRKNSEIMSRESNQVIKAIQEGLGGIRDILIDGSQKFYCKLYRDADLKLRAAAANNQIISGTPKYMMESLGIVFIAYLAYFLTGDEASFVSSLPLLGALAIGAQKILPILQQAYHAYTSVRGYELPLTDVLKLLDQEFDDSKFTENIKNISFNKKIVLKNLTFGYTNDKSDLILKNVSLEIPKGSHFGFIGETGCGKSTLFDLIMGLLKPLSGKLIIDGVDIKNNIHSWQKHISHVPQEIFLIDGSIKNNIAFGILDTEIDMELVKKSASIAKISETIEGWTYGYDTAVGERGVKLSGGQRQRIGIARALYKQTSVIIFDEATSALDSETEKQVMKNIANLSKDITVLSIAHRITSLSICDSIVRVGNGKNIEVLTNQDLDKLNKK